MRYRLARWLQGEYVRLYPREELETFEKEEKILRLITMHRLKGEFSKLIF